MEIDKQISARPQRTLIAYCALAERLSKPGSNMLQALVPFFSEACQEFAGQFFDASKFSIAVKQHYGIDIPKLAALGIAEQLANEGVLEIVSGYAQSTTYRYSESIKSASQEVSSLTEKDVEKILALFTAYCNENQLPAEKAKNLHADFLDRLLHIDSMRLLARREASIAAKKSVDTLQLAKGQFHIEQETKDSLHLDFLVSSFLIDLRDSNPQAFETASNIAFANMAAEAIACFREPQQEAGNLSGLTVLLDTPLILDMLGINAEYTEYGKDLLHMLKGSGCNISVLDHSIIEAENAVQARLTYLRSGINQASTGFSVTPNFLAALIGNVAERVENRLGIHIKKDPELNLLRRSQTTVGDIESDMTNRMQAWRNEDAKQHDRKSVWSIITLRDSATLQPRICKAGWLLLTRNTPLLKISNDAWKTWLRGSTKHSQVNIERWAPVAMTDKQFAGYVWARTGGGPSTISQTLLLAHCSAAVRPRADVKAKAYNLILEMHGKAEADDIVALFEDREGGRALMRATLGDPDDVTAQRLPYIMERVKLSAGEFAAAHVRAEAEKQLQTERESHQQSLNQFEVNANAEKEVLRFENERKAQELCEQHAKTVESEEKAKNLQADLQLRQSEEEQRSKTSFEKAFLAALREHRCSRALFVLVFGITAWMVSSNVLELSPGISALATIATSCFGFWFVPEYLDPIAVWLANKRLHSVLNQIAPHLKVSDIATDYKNKIWNIS